MKDFEIDKKQIEKAFIENKDLIFKNMLIEDSKYKSPINIFMGGLNTSIENDIMTAVQKYGINVDKEELIKALQYDRNQYEKGYQQGHQEAELYKKALELFVDWVVQCYSGYENLEELLEELYDKYEYEIEEKLETGEMDYGEGLMYIAIQEAKEN